MNARGALTVTTDDHTTTMPSTDPTVYRVSSASSSSPSRFRPLTPFQQTGILAFLVISAFDVVISSHLFFGGSGAYIEANPLLAWSSGSLVLFLAVILSAKSIGATLITVMASFANHYRSVVGDVTVFSAVGTTTALFLYMLVAIGG